MKKKVLWIEDGALADLAELVGPVYKDGQFDLTLALDATEGLRCLLSSKYDVVIVDIRIPPGDAEDWIRLYQKRELGPEARLGLELLKSVLGESTANIHLTQRPKWLNPHQIAVFTVESWHEVATDLRQLGIQVFQTKNAESSHRILVGIIQEVLHHQPKEREPEQ